MNKEELIQLKKELEEKREKIKEKTYTKRFLVWNASRAYSCTHEEIESNTNLQKSIDLIEKYYEEVIRHYTEKDCDFDSIELALSYSNITPYYLEEKMDSYDISHDKECLPNLINVRIRGYECMKDGVSLYEKGVVLPDELFKENYDEYVVPYDEFVSTLQDRGFEFEKVPTMEEIKYCNNGEWDAMYKLILDLPKKKTL